MKKKNINRKETRLNKHLALSLFLLFFFTFSLTNAQNSTSNINSQENQAVIYVSEGTTISGVEEIEGAKIVFLEKKPEVEIKKASVPKSHKSTKEKVKQLVAPKKKVHQYKKTESDKVISYPDSSESSSFISISKKNNIVVPTNVQQFSKFIEVAKYRLLKENFVLRKTIFTYLLKKQQYNFSEIYNVRPPPVSFQSLLIS